MIFEVYCDETLPDLLSSRKPGARYLLIGSLWLPSTLREEVKAKIASLKAKHAVWGEVKWTKISTSKQSFYENLVDLFASYGEDMRFRCIAVDREQANLILGDDQELGFYKFYYQMLHHWILDFNEYHIFCDLKKNRNRRRMQELRNSLGESNLSSKIANVQSLPSREVALLQLCDVLLGAVSGRLNDKLGQDTAKMSVVRKLEDGLGIENSIKPTSRTEEKFNVFKVHPEGGW